MPCDFDFDIKKKDWKPKEVKDLVNEVSRAFCTKVTLDDLYIQGTDYMQKQRIKTDAELKTWLKTESKTYEKLIKVVKIPRRLVTDTWKPKKDRILVKGSMLAKYYGDEEVSTRNVQFSLKIHDCGHFRLKQTLPGSGASPYWVIFEGKWEKKDRGFGLEFCIRYPYQKSKKHEFDLSFEAMPEDNTTNLAFTDERESQLNGMLPTIVGTEPLSWVELCQEHDAEHAPATRFYEDGNSDDDERQDGRPAEPQKPRPAGSPRASGPPIGEAKPSETTGARQRSAVKTEPAADPEPVDEEPAWPLYLGAGVFLLMFVALSWGQWGSALMGEEDF